MHDRTFGDYPIEYWKDAKGRLHCTFPDLPKSGFSARNLDALDAAAREMFTAWVARAEKLGTAVPAPGSREAFSGVLRVRVSRSMHRQLLALCEAHDVAISNLTTALLSSGLDRLESKILGDQDERQARRASPPVMLVRRRRINYSGTAATGSWTQNVPIELQQRLHLMAGAENVSINLLVNLLLKDAVADFVPAESEPKIESAMLRTASA